MHDRDTDPISERMRVEEARLRRRVLLFTLIPAAIAGVLITVTSVMVANARDTLDGLEVLNTSLDAEIEMRLEALEATRRRVDSLEARAAALEEGVTRLANAAVADSIGSAASLEFRTMMVNQLPRIYLHIRQAGQRRAARAVQEQLQEAGYDVPGIEHLPNGPTVSEIRYFKSNERAGAEEIQRLLESAGVSAIVTDLSERYGSSESIRPGQYEIWFGTDFGGL